jgi:hypothetical protein
VISLIIVYAKIKEMLVFFNVNCISRKLREGERGERGCSL